MKELRACQPTETNQHPTKITVYKRAYDQTLELKLLIHYPTPKMLLTYNYTSQKILLN